VALLHFDDITQQSTMTDKYTGGSIGVVVMEVMRIILSLVVLVAVV
jgi:hypothetical protein